MAKQEVKLQKQVYGKVSYPKVVDTEFKQLVQPDEVEIVHAINKRFDDCFFCLVC